MGEAEQPAGRSGRPRSGGVAPSVQQPAAGGCQQPPRRLPACSRPAPLGLVAPLPPLATRTARTASDSLLTSLYRLYRHPRTAGKYVELKDTIADFKGVLDGKYDDLPEMAFYMVGKPAGSRREAGGKLGGACMHLGRRRGGRRAVHRGCDRARGRPGAGAGGAAARQASPPLLPPHLPPAPSLLARLRTAAPPALPPPPTAERRHQGGDGQGRPDGGGDCGQVGGAAGHAEHAGHAAVGQPARQPQGPAPESFPPRARGAPPRPGRPPWQAAAAGHQFADACCFCFHTCLRERGAPPGCLGTRRGPPALHPFQSSLSFQRKSGPLMRS